LTELTHIICLKSETDDYLQRWARLGLTAAEIKPHTEKSNIITLTKTPEKPQGVRDDSGVSCFGGVLHG
jgi:hypothetical protein